MEIAYLYWSGGGTREEYLENRRRTFEYTRRAERVEPDNALVIATLAWDLYELDRDLQGSARELTRAVSLGPNDTQVLTNAGAFAERIGAWDHAIALRRRAAELDPLCISCLGQYARVLAWAGRYDESLEVMNRYLPRSTGRRYTLAKVHLLRGAPQDALRVYEGKHMNDYSVNAGRAMALFDLGRYEESAAALERQVEEFGDYEPREVAIAYAWTGDADKAFEWIERYGGMSEHGSYHIFVPIWRRIHDDPRWQALREKAGLSEARLEALDFNPVLPD